MPDAIAAAQSAHLTSAFAKEELRSLRLVMYVRIAASGAIVIFMLLRFPDPGGLYWASLTAVFGAFGILQYLIPR